MSRLSCTETAGAEATERGTFDQAKKRYATCFPWSRSGYLFSLVPGFGELIKVPNLDVKMLYSIPS